MFESLSDRLQDIAHKIKGYGKITEENIAPMMREIRLSLLEADVNYKVVKEFTNTVKEKALGEEVSKSLNPGELFVKIVRDELQELLGGDSAPLVTDKKPTIVMLVGLQGSGKTTTIGKLANFLRKKHSKKPLLVACDVYRPAAIDQLKQIGRELNIEVYSEGKGNPVEISKNAIKYANDNGFDYILIDTAGRLHIDEELMDELKNISEEVKPHEILLVIDSMMGQDAINVITGFNEALKLTGVILTKLDGDTRGGVALSVRHLTNIPIKFIGVSEKMDGLSEFHPDRMANRIIGMGDVISLVEKVQDEIDEEEAMKAAKKMTKGNFNNIERWWNRMLRRDYLNILGRYGDMGVRALEAATPVDSGITAGSWIYEITNDGKEITLAFKNTNENDNLNIVILLMYGHGTRNGGYVKANDFVNPAVKPIFKELAESAWKEVTK